MRTAPATHSIVEAKLYPGVGARQVLSRPKLGPPAEFQNGSRTVVVISAPAGYGKSTMMATWHQLLREQKVACGWLSLDPDDDDAARLLRHLIAAFQRINSTIGKSAISEIRADIFASVKPALESLAADLSVISSRAVMFLDDLQFLSSSEALEIINWLINYSPRGCQYVIGSREEPRLRLAGLRMRHQLLEFGYRELPFSTEEAQRFFEARLGQSLRAKDVQRLVLKTEGWPAALELAALAMRNEDDRAGIIERFAGSDRGVVDYLGEVVLQRLDARTQAFILRVAQFDRVNAELAAAVTDEIDAGALLIGLHASNLFLVPLDRTSQWFRFHPLAAEFFRERFRRAGGDTVAVLRLGADWLYQNGHIEEGINAAIRAEAWETATAWVAESVEELVYKHGYHQTILRWMTRLPAESVDRFPTIRIHYAFALAFSPHQQEVEAQVHRLEKIRKRMLLTPDVDSAMIDEIQCELELQKVLSQALRDDGLSARTGAQAWLDRWPDAPLIRRGTVGNVLTFGLKTAGEIDAGLQLATTTRIWLKQCEGWYSLAWTEYLSAMLYMKRGAYFEARRVCQAGLELLQLRLDGHPAHASLFHSILATVAYEFDELDKAREHLDLCMPRVAEFGQADAVLMGYLTAAKLDRVQHGENAGLDMLHEGQELGERRDLPRVTISLAAEECGWHGRAERFEDARRVAVRHGFDRLPETSGKSNVRSEKAFLVASRFLLRRSAPEVIKLIDQPISRCQDRGLFRRWVELLMLKAMAHRHNGEQGKAVHCLEELIGIAAPRNYFRTILDEAPDLVTLFDRLDSEKLRGTESAPLVRRLMVAMKEPTVRRVNGSKVSGLIEELSKRELAILKRLESDLSNKEIADSLFISWGTLKWHLHNIYGKLSVKSRLSAVSKARALNLL